MIHVSEPKQYIRQYSGFAGVDFSSDQVLVKQNRFPYAINVYKDYRSTQGQAIETIAGFSKSVILPFPIEYTGSKNVYKVFPYRYFDGTALKTVHLVHAGTYLYAWENYPFTANTTVESGLITIIKESEITTRSYALPTSGVSIDSVEINGEVMSESVVDETQQNGTAPSYTISTVGGVSSVVFNNNVALIEGDQIVVFYKESVIAVSDALYTSLADNKSSFVVYNGICYINDGTTFYKVSFVDTALVCSQVVGAIPTTYANRIPKYDGTFKDEGSHLCQRNILSTKYKNTFIAPTPKEIYTELNVGSCGVVAPTYTNVDKPISSGAIKKHKIKLTFANPSSIVAGVAEMTLASTFFGKDADGLIKAVIFPSFTSVDTTGALVAVKIEAAMLANSLILEHFSVTRSGADIYLSALEYYPIALTYPLEKNVGEVLSDNVTVKIYGTAYLPTSAEYPFTYDKTKGTVKFTGATVTESDSNKKITLTKIPLAPEDMSYDVSYNGVEITCEKADESTKIKNCTITALFDNRVFYCGNSDYPSTVWYSQLDDASYVGEYNFFTDGKGQENIKGIMSVADTLMVLKEDSPHESSLYYHSPKDTEDDIIPRIYVGEASLSRLGCIGGCTVFRDVPLFVSRLGVEGVGQLTAGLERILEHKSSLIDGQFVNENGGDLSDCILEEWNGYLIALIDGKMYLGDSRQTYEDEIGNIQYEWYYIEGVGVYENQYTRCDFIGSPIWWNGSDNMTVPLSVDDATAVDTSLYIKEILSGDSIIANAQTDEDGTSLNPVTSATYTIERTALPTASLEEKGRYYKYTGETDEDYINGTIYRCDYDEETSVYFWSETTKTYCYDVDYITVDEVNYLVESKAGEGLIGGNFKKATAIIPYNSNIIFGTENGVICAFHFDKRVNVEIPINYYHFDGRVIPSGIATVFDNCGYPYLTKTTVKKSLVIKCKTLLRSKLNIKVRTDKKAYEENDGTFKVVGSVKNGFFSFDNIDFTDMNFNVSEQNTFVVNEREKKWIEKQLFLYSDSYQQPFSLYHITYGFYLAGRVK